MRVTEPWGELMRKAVMVSRDEAETCDLVVCVKASQHAVAADDILAPCARCGETVAYRPSAPTIPKKLCVECAIETLKAETVEPFRGRPE